MIRNPRFYSVLEIQIDLVEKEYNKVFTDYEELAKAINKNFKNDVTKEDIETYYTSYYLPEAEDAKLIIKNSGVSY